MISRTVRYFKLMYIVAGILMSNEDVCETVDKIQIAPLQRVKEIEVKQILQPKRVVRKVEKVSRSWLHKCDFLGLGRIKQRLSGFTIWTIPNYLVDRSTSYISKRFMISSDCDMIYNK